ncbi:MAG: hypothetical protein GY930_05160 [bacterium]|nr:hypothetical protein [bacterium]
MKTLHLPYLAALFLGATTTLRAQQSVYSIDWRSPSVGIPDAGTATPMTSGDLLIPTTGLPAIGPLPMPTIGMTHGLGGLGLIPGCIGVPGGAPCPVEVDALSFGQDLPVTPNGFAPGQLHFSVDSFAMGIAGGTIVPNVTSEGPVGDASADVMLNPLAIPGAPLPPGPSMGHRGIWDGDGMASGTGFSYPGLGLIEPNMPGPAPAAMGDNLDALDTLPFFPGVPPVAFFSLDSMGGDPLTSLPHNATAVGHGFTGADVLVSVAAGLGPVLYAPGPALGLNLVPAVNRDDLDALILWENGDGIFQPSHVPFDWMTGASDMLLFSVRRGSAVIGMPDSIFGLPIEEGDILTTPLPSAMGGTSPFPGIFIAAENIGLGTVRSGTVLASNFGDDLDALDSVNTIIHDCDGDGVEDVVAIATGLVADANMNGVPDSCESTVSCVPLPNSTGVSTLLTGTMGSSVGSGLHLEATSGPPTQFGYFLIGTGVTAPGLPIASGILCLDTSPGNAVGRYNIAGTSMNSIGLFDAAGILQNGVGTSTVGSGLDVPSMIPTIGGMIVSGSTWHFQLWHRDIPLTSNFSNAISVTF